MKKAASSDDTSATQVSFFHNHPTLVYSRSVCVLPISSLKILERHVHRVDIYKINTFYYFIKDIPKSIRKKTKLGVCGSEEYSDPMTTRTALYHSLDSC